MLCYEFHFVESELRSYTDERAFFYEIYASFFQVNCLLRCSIGDWLWQVMYSFLDRLINLGLPRTRDFQGVSPNSFDGNGNYSIGFREQSVFPEISYDALGKPRGMDVCISTTAPTDKEAHKLLALMGMPFREGAAPTNVVRKKKLKRHHFDSKAKQRARRWLRTDLYSTHWFMSPWEITVLISQLLLNYHII